MGIVVGVDGSGASAAALRWAVGEAALRGIDVSACLAWHATYSGSGPPPDEAAYEAAARKALDVVVDQVGAPVERVVVRGVPASVLIDACRDADLLVIGSHDGHLGAVARQVLAHAPCPVVVVPDNS